MLTDPTAIENDLATQIIGCAMTVHRHFGPGLVESVYETCLCHELAKAGMKVVRQKRQPIFYDGIIFDDPFRLDVFVNDAIIIENKVVETVLPLHKVTASQLLETGQPPPRPADQFQCRTPQGRCSSCR